MGRWTTKLTVVALAIALAAGAFEAGLRAFAHVAPQLELDIYRKDDDGLLLLRPGVARRHVAPQWDVEVRINHAGWRDDEAGPEPGDHVVLGLGDSQAFGWGVYLPHTFYALAEERLRRNGPARLIKAAVPSTATVDQVRVLEKLAPIYRPRTVVAALYVGNDFTENGLGGSDRLDVDDGLLLLRPRDGVEPGAAERAKRWLARRSHLAQLLRAVQFNLQRGQLRLPQEGEAQGREWDAWMRDFAQIHLAQPDAAARRGIEITLESLDRIVELCAEFGVESFVLVVIPRSLQVYPHEALEMRRALGLGEDGLRLDAAQELLRDWQAQQTKLPVRVVDPLEAFRAEALLGRALYFTPDAHLSPAGHAAVAEAMGDLALRE